MFEEMRWFATGGSVGCEWAAVIGEHIFKIAARLGVPAIGHLGQTQPPFVVIIAVFVGLKQLTQRGAVGSD